MGPSSEGTTVFMRRLVHVILCGPLSGMQGGIFFISRCISGRNMYRVINIIRINIL